MKSQSIWTDKQINGQVEQLASIVLTDWDLKRHPQERRALEGVVQSLLLTSHLFFVGFSLTDDNFLKLATAASKVRARAQVKIALKPGTAVALTDQDRDQAQYRDLHMLTMASGSFADGAHMLEIFLDRLLWTAATQGDLSSEYLVDDTYASGLTKRDSQLRNLLLSIPEAADTEARSSPGWRRVEKCLRELGMTRSVSGSD